MDVIISPEIIIEIEFWIRNVHILNGRMFDYNPVANSVVFSDASGVGGAVIISDTLNRSELIAHCNWLEKDAVESSTYREMFTVLYGLQQFENILSNKVLDWFTDSSNII